MIRAVLFDLDGTLIRLGRRYADFLSELGAHWGILDPVDPFYEAYAKRILAEGAVTFRSAVEHALLASGREPPANMGESCFSAVNAYASEIEVIPGVEQLLSSFEGLPKAVVSNGPADMQRASLARSGLQHYFQEVLISGDVEVAVRKPNSRIFHLACDRLNTAAVHTLMIGDNLEADIEGAIAAGLMARHVSTFRFGD